MIFGIGPYKLSSIVQSQTSYGDLAGFYWQVLVLEMTWVGSEVKHLVELCDGILLLGLAKDGREVAVLNGF